MVVYVDGVRVGEALALEETPHHIIHRLCELDLAVSELEQPPRQKGVGFRLKLPNLTEGKHEVRCHAADLIGAESCDIHDIPIDVICLGLRPRGFCFGCHVGITVDQCRKIWGPTVMQCCMSTTLKLLAMAA